MASNTKPGPPKQRKRSNSELDISSQTNRPVKHPRLASHQTLNSIAEEDESLAGDTDIPEHPEHNYTRLTGKAQFIDALADSNDDGESGGGSDSGMEEIDEEIDIEVSSGGSSEDED